MTAKLLRLVGVAYLVIVAVVAAMGRSSEIVVAITAAMGLAVVGFTTADIRRRGAVSQPAPELSRPRCAHTGAIPVESVLGEVVAHLCPACGEQLPEVWPPPVSPLASVFGGVTMAEAQAALTEFMRQIGRPPVILPPADPDPLPAGQGCAICGGEPAVYSDAAGHWRPVCGACSDGPECTCNAATGGSPCTSPRCIRLDLPVRHWTGRGYVTGTLTWRQAASQGYSEQDIGLGRVPLAPAGETVPEDGDVAEIAWVSEHGTVCWCSYCGGRAGVHGPEAVALYRAECEAALKRIEAGASATIYTSGSVITAAGGGAGGYSSTSSTCHPHGPGEPCSPSRLGYPGDRAQWKP